VLQSHDKINAKNHRRSRDDGGAFAGYPPAKALFDNFRVGSPWSKLNLVFLSIVADVTIIHGAG